MSLPQRVSQPRSATQRSLRFRARGRRNARLSLRCELLEPRWMLSADLAGSDGDRTVPMTWFDSVPQAKRIPPASLHRVDRFLPEGVAGPQQRSTGEWIVQLTDEAIEQIVRITDVNDLIRDPSLRLQFSLITGLGSEGLVLVRGQGESQGWIEASLASNVSVDSFSLNQLIRGEDVNPGDIDYQLGRLDNLDQIGAPAVWHETIGSMRTVVGVLDTGIDYTHPDIFLNLWFNQGEIPSRFYDDQGDLLLTDIDGDGLITFYDLNNVTRSATEPYALHFGGWQNGPNATYVRDLNGNGYIDAHDILNDPLWADGRDTDGNGEADDFFGVNFMSDGVRNAPFDTLGHGTHVAGTIGAVGGNGLGVVGINWQTSLMPLRILDSTNQGDTSAAIRAVNYATTMRDRYRVDSEQRVQQGANVRVLNNSWGQPGGYEAALEQAIANADDAGILFVAAAGNGNFLGQSVDNDRTPFYPASYDVPNVIAVAAGLSGDRLAPFSNYGRESVDLVAPGIGIRSTEAGGGYGSRNGTSMATPHVTGAAALIWSALPEATVEEVRGAILGSVVHEPLLTSLVATGGRLDAAAAFAANVFAPSARLVAAENVNASGGTATVLTVEYFHRAGIDISTIGNDDLVIERQWGLPERFGATLFDVRLSDDQQTALATYSMLAPGTKFTGTTGAIGPATVPVSYPFASNQVVEIAPDLTTIVTSEITVENVPPLFDSLTVSLEIDHTWNGDLIATLVSPTGQRVTLFDRVGNASENFHGTILDDAAELAIQEGSGPFVGRFRPQSTLSSFVGTDPTGIWILEIEDVTNNDGGQLRAWGLDFVRVEEQPIPHVIVEGVAPESVAHSVSLEIHHLKISNATATLIAPGGGRARLFENLTIGSDFGGELSFDDQAIADLGAQATVGRFRPLETLASLNGGQPNGTWIVELTGDVEGSISPILIASLEGFNAWDVSDYGVYRISTRHGGVTGSDSRPIEQRDFGSFDVRIDEPGVIYVDTFDDTLEAGSLRAAILQANTSQTPTTIILNPGTYSIQIPPMPDPASAFPAVTDLGGFTSRENVWSGVETGDFTIESEITIIGSLNDNTAIDGNNIDRVFRVFPDASLTLKNLSIQRGVSDGIGGAVLSLGHLETDLLVVRNSQAGLGGAIGVVGRGQAAISRSRVTENISQYGAIYVGGDASLDFANGTMDANVGGALQSTSTGDVSVSNSTFSANVGGVGAVASGFGGLAGATQFSSISGDGRFVSFTSGSSHLVPGDDNRTLDVFVYDLEEGRIERVSVSNTGAEGNFFSFSSSITADGRFIAFESYASNLVPGDTNDAIDVFVFDRHEKTIERVSVSDTGDEGNGWSVTPDISDDGRFVVFQSEATNLVPVDNNEHMDIFVHDRQQETVKRINTNHTGNEANGRSDTPSISGDGLFVAFRSDASNLVPGDTNVVSDVFVYGQQLDQIERVSVSDNGIEGDDWSGDPSISADGRFVAFSSHASNLVPGDTNGNIDVFVYDRSERRIRRVSVTDAGEQGNGNSISPTISADGNFVAFTSNATNLLPGDTVGKSQIFVYNLLDSRIELASVAIDGGPANDHSGIPAISANGRFVTFHSAATDLGPGLTDGLNRLFVYDRESGSVRPVPPPLGQMSVASSTFVDNALAPATVAGNVSIANSLFSRNQVGNESDIPFPSDSFNLKLVGEDRELIRELRSPSGLPPVHELLFGNPAIDAGDRALVGSFDQRDQLRLIPDIGAVNAVLGSLYGTVYADLNGNGIRDTGEPLIPEGRAEFVHVAQSLGQPELLQADGKFAAEGLIPQTYLLEGVPLDAWRVSDQPVLSVLGEFAGDNGDSGPPTISADGRYIAFQSDASNLVPGDNNGRTDVFVYDRVERRVERVSVSDSGEEGNGASESPWISADGRFVAFQSRADNLVSGDTNDRTDIFVFDRLTRKIERVSVSDTGQEGNHNSRSPSISGDGALVTFESDSSNLVPGDTNGRRDVFVYDRGDRTVKRVSVNDAGVEGNGDSGAPHISRDGRLVSFQSLADNLVPGDDNGQMDLFVYDLEESQVERLVAGAVGDDENDLSRSFSFSDDKRFLTFSSELELVPEDTNGVSDVFIYDFQEGEVRRVSVSDAGVEGNGPSFYSALSADGRFVTFLSFANNLVPGDFNNSADVIMVANPFLPPRVSVTIRPGEIVDGVEIGLVPDPGRISGRLFYDTGVPNGVFDAGESVLSGHTLFIDANRNGLLDPGELRTETDHDGIFRFEDVPAYREHVLVVTPSPGHERVTPDPGSVGGFSLFLSAGGNLRELDFGFRPVRTTGQSSASVISGRVMIDTNGNGIIEDDDEPAAHRVVYLDGGNLGVRDFNDPQTVTDANGYYQFAGLPATITPIRVILNAEVEQVFPLGSEFTLETFPLQDVEKREGNPQAVITAHFNPDDDDFLDVAVVLAHTNTLSIRLNDGSGGFLPEKFDFDLKLIAGDVLFSGPLAIVAGHFDDDPRIDVAITGNLSSNVMVLRNLDPATGEFADHQVIGVGAEPLGIVAGPFTGGPDTDLVVLTKSASSLYVLTNNGSGLFSAGPAIPTGGTLPASLVASDFSGDGNLDVAVTHAVFSTNDHTGGRVTLLTGNGAGGFTLHPTSYAVGASAAGSVVGDFNGDGLPDLAVANFGSNSISVLINQGDGTFQVQSQTLGTVQGALDIAVADIDNDGDNDILVSKLQTRQIAIFRNNGVDPVSGEVLFEPQENVGLGQFQFAERMPFALANLDNDTSGPGGSGTIDIVAVPQNTDTLYVLRNTLVQGSRRASVSGSPSDVSAGIDFLIRPAVLPPRFDEIGDPPAILEDATAQTVTVSGIQKGREAGPALQFWVTSSHPGLIPSPGLIPYGGGTTTSFSYAPLPDANGTAVLTVRAIDAGYDGTFGTSADASFERSFTVTVLPVNDPPTFSRPRTRSVLQTAGPQNIAGYVTNIGPGGGPDEASQTLSEFTVDVDTTFFLQPPAINAFGRLTFTPNPGRSGFVEGSISLSDNGGRANGGIDTTTRFFVLNILMVNQPPTFEIGGDVTVNAGAGPQQHPGFARDFHPGGGEDEEEQTISDFVVATDRPDLFASVPDISNDGTLIYTPLSSNSGTALVTVRVRDDGGRSNGGNDLSEPRTFQIRIEPATSPTVGWMQIGSGSPQRSMVSGLSVEFDQVVDVTADAFEVERIESETIVPVALTVTAGQVAGRTRVQLHFDGPHVNGGSLIDGNYRLRILGAKIIAGGNPLDGGGGPGSDYVDQFFRLYGDANGDGTVDLFDFAQFRSLFGKSVDQDPLVATLDVDGNGSINLLDFAAFRSNFGKSRL